MRDRQASTAVPGCASPYPAGGLRHELRHPVPTTAAGFAYPANLTSVTVFGYGSRSNDGVWPQLHADQLALLPDAQCRGLRAAFGPLSTQLQACTGRWTAGC